MFHVERGKYEAVFRQVVLLVEYQFRKKTPCGPPSQGGHPAHAGLGAGLGGFYSLAKVSSIGWINKSGT